MGGGCGRMNVLPPMIRRIERNERFRPFDVGRQILTAFVFDKLPEKGLCVRLFPSLFPECFQKILRGFVHQNLPELGAIILYQADALDHDIVDLPLSVH